jgi:hypothetical protein
MLQPVVPNSPPVPNPFPDPVQPDGPPFEKMEPPPHISFQIWQDSWYDASSHAPMGVWVQLGAGPCDPGTGRLNDGDWHKPGVWKQV